MKGENVIKIRIAVLISVGLFLLLGYAFSQETKSAQSVEVTQSQEASVSSPVESKEEISKKAGEIELILSGPLPIFWSAS